MVESCVRPQPNATTIDEISIDYFRAVLAIRFDLGGTIDQLFLILESCWVFPRCSKPVQNERLTFRRVSTRIVMAEFIDMNCYAILPVW